MVGVPGRSKGCHSCRKQKIACSQERPECAICRKAGRKCPGYLRDRIFVNLAPSKGGSKAEKLQEAPSAKQPTSLRKNGQYRVRIKQEEQDLLLVAGPGPDSALIAQQSLSLAAFRGQLLGTFLSDYIPPPTALSKLGRVEQHWLSMLTNMPCISRALDVAVVAFCTAKLGRAAADKTLVTESLRLYSRGLRELQRALYDPQQMYADDTLGACVLLAMYEAYECPAGSRNGYLSHVAGCSRLIQLRGPEAHAEGLGHYIFTSFRFMATLEAFVSKNTFLEQPLWMTQPFRTMGKSPLNRLLDMMLEAPGLMRRADQLESLPTPEARYTGAVSLLCSLCDLEDRLLLFYKEFENRMLGPPYREIVTPPDKLNTRDIFPFIYTFDDIRTAGVLALYWAVMLMLTTGIFRMRPLVAYLHSFLEKEEIPQVEELNIATPTAEKGSTSQAEPVSNAAFSPESSAITESDPDVTFSTETFTDQSSISISSTPDDIITMKDSPLPATYDPHDFAHYARQVCKTVPYCLSEGHSDLGLGAVTAPLHIVFETLLSFGDLYAPECRWARAMLKKISGEGMGIVDFLSGVSDESLSAADKRKLG